MKIVSSYIVKDMGYLTMLYIVENGSAYMEGKNMLGSNTGLTKVSPETAQRLIEEMNPKPFGYDTSDLNQQ